MLQVKALFSIPHDTTARRILKDRLGELKLIRWHFHPDQSGERFDATKVYIVTADGARKIGSKFIPLREGASTHLLFLNDVRIDIHLAAGDHLHRWDNDATLKAKRGNPIPDAFFVLRYSEDYYSFYLEADRDTEPAKIFKEKVTAYIAAFDNGSIYDAPVLTVTTTPARLNTLLRVCREAGADERFLFTSSDLVNVESVLSDPIWYDPLSSQPVALLEW